MQKTLPKGWITARLDEVCLKITDGSHRTPKLLDSGYPFLTVVNIKDGRFDFSNVKYIAKEDYKDLVKNDCKPLKGDILFSKDGTIGKVLEIKEDKDIVVLSSIAILRPNQKILNSSYLALIASSDVLTKQAIAMQSGSALRRIILKNLKTAKIPLPPLPTQHKIVEILEEADNLRKLRQQADEKMKDLIPSLFVQMFGDPVTNPKGWEVKKLEEVCDIKSGGTPSRNIKEYWGGNIPWLGSTVCKDMPVYTAEEFITITGLEKSAAKIFKHKTTLIALVGATIGRTAFLTFEAATNQNIAGLYPLNSNILIPEFIFYFSQTLYNEFLKLGEEKFRMANLSFIRGLKILLPPLSLQQEFAKLVEDIEAEKARQAESKKKLDELFQSLMQKAFTGELVA